MRAGFHTANPRRLPRQFQRGTSSLVTRLRPRHPASRTRRAAPALRTERSTPKIPIRQPASSTQHLLPDAQHSAIAPSDYRAASTRTPATRRAAPGIGPAGQHPRSAPNTSQPKPATICLALGTRHSAPGTRTQHPGPDARKMPLKALARGTGIVPHPQSSFGTRHPTPGSCHLPASKQHHRIDAGSNHLFFDHNAECIGPQF